MQYRSNPEKERAEWRTQQRLLLESAVGAFTLAAVELNPSILEVDSVQTLLSGVAEATKSQPAD